MTVLWVTELVLLAVNDTINIEFVYCAGSQSSSSPALIINWEMKVCLRFAIETGFHTTIALV